MLKSIRSRKRNARKKKEILYKMEMEMDIISVQPYKNLENGKKDLETEKNTCFSLPNLLL